MKLIILNGSPAAGKSTVAKKLHESMPFSLLADVDVWRKLVGAWQENRSESLKLAYVFTVAAVDSYLGTGHDVIVDKAILSDADGVLDALVAAGKKHNAEVYEFILTADRDVIRKRADERGYHERLLTPERVLELYDMAVALVADRSKAIVIDTTNLKPEDTFETIKRHIS